MIPRQSASPKPVPCPGALVVKKGSGSRVGDLEPYPLSSRILPGRQGEPPRPLALPHRLVRVGDEIHRHLLELVRVRPQDWQVGGQVQPHFHVVHP